MNFSNKTAIVTGAGQGIGFEICRQLAKYGATVLLNDIDKELADSAAERIRSENGNCISVPGDSGDMHFVNDLVQQVPNGHLDIAIANAGITLFGDFLSYPAESLYKVLHVNIGGTFFLAQAAARQMKLQGTGGALLFTSSVTGHQAHKDLAAYSMTKAALEMLAKNLVVEVSQYGITVNTVAPGATLTERTESDPEYASIWSRITPMGKPASVNDIANAALFLVSDHARHITGQTLLVDGGWTATSPSPY
jgi:NAD(P)-dependent dehydrogenase (short-subunit alcohol dehydrogenase family)